MTDVATQLVPVVAAEITGPTWRRQLEGEYAACGMVRPFRRTAHEPGDRLEYAITGVHPARTGRMVVEVEKFVGGGFAGQVYRVRLVALEGDDGPIEGLEVGGRYAIKVLKPPSGFACAFRNFLYFLAYQGPFSAQVNPASVRVGVLWQKLIRRAASRRIGEDTAVCDTYATFYDAELRSFGEINEWISGRIWKFEVDDDLFGRWRFEGAPPADHQSPEFVYKKIFMREIVGLLHDMGAPELARQYEWWTCKSQPNVLKRLSEDHSPKAGLTAVDFRAGLALLPLLPMSPADVWLILRGLARGRLVQFDRSDPGRFERFIESHREDFADLQPVVEELRTQESVHRRSLPDVTHHHVRLLTDRSLRASIKDASVTAWHNLGRLDDEHAARLRRGNWAFRLLYLLSFIPLLGRGIVKLWGNAPVREHARRCLTSFRYLWRAMRASRIEVLIVWHRDGRGSDERLRGLVDRPVRYWVQRILVGWMPPRWHRFLTEPAYAKARIREAVGFTYMLLRVPAFREEWLLDQVRMGREEGMLTPPEADKISQQIKDPFIQKYLRCVAVHACTVPITQVVMVIVGGAVLAYGLTYRQWGWTESMAAGVAAAGVVQVLPISPGSLARGLFVLYLMIRERDIKNYCIAAPVSFIHVVGYLAFPLQMVAHDPALARFMAGRWAKSMVHTIPVFGESGGLLEHFVFDFFFNLPLTARRGFKTRPLRWTLGTVGVATVVGLLGWGAYVRISAYLYTTHDLHDVRVVAVTPYPPDAADDAIRGMRVELDGYNGVIDFPGDRWDAAIDVGDTVDAMVRRSRLSDESVGVEIIEQAP